MERVRGKLAPKIGRALILAVLSSAAWADDVDRALGHFAVECGVAAERFRSAPAILLTDGNYSGSWRRISRDALRKCDHCYENVTSWKGEGGSTLVELQRSSESGDWMHYVLYCYGEQGGLKKVFSDFNCSWGWAALQEFIPRGTALQRTSRAYRKLDNWKLITQPNYVAEWKEHIDDVPAYLRLDKTPFAAFLK